MKDINVGIISLILSEKIKDVFLKEKKLNEREEGEYIQSLDDFIKVLNESSILKTEFDVFNNIEEKHVLNENMALRYVDDNIKLFEIYTIDEIKEEREKLKNFYDKNYIKRIDENKLNLFKSINNLIIESLKPHEKINVDTLHESFDCVLEHIKVPKDKKETERGELLNINEEIIEIGINLLNKKYGDILEEDRNFIKKISISNKEEKKEMFESLKRDTLKMLEEIEDPNLIDRKHMAIEKVNVLEYDNDKGNSGLIKLYELKNGLL